MTVQDLILKLLQCDPSALVSLRIYEKYEGITLREWASDVEETTSVYSTGPEVQIS